eukprot:CAMPEP_0202979630 /NCGR_PEP_ID=MMETSP1396-20130829/85725_1 /ASSEMBLY_ACC=CAM_ASM_000872 /TAXON_ID= /ORGANISM="Pseudokeronopsis sp., Strain Brazil" /LENGTH=212 /DNA_ID=CAMNT_0049719139 /DNA_START=1433 /DNA_END=2071 /DNA_ORIENTATION=+
MKEISNNNSAVLKNYEQIAKLRCNVDIVQRDINQKRKLIADQKGQVEGYKTQIKEMDSDLRQREDRLQDLEETLKSKDGEINDLEEMINSKELLIDQLNKELLDLDEKRRREEEERRLRELEANKKPERKWYIPLKGDAIDEMMAKYLNECDYYVPVKRLGEGQYLYGSKKIFAKIMNGKLIIRVGGGYMLIDEFLKNYAEIENDRFGEGDE